MSINEQQFSPTRNDRFYNRLPHNVARGAWQESLEFHLALSLLTVWFENYRHVFVCCLHSLLLSGMF